jgi:mono/diheme cytochrome c family protein
MRSIVSVLVGAGILWACAATSPPAPSGGDTFVTHCAACHGMQGEGDGPVAATLRVTMPNLRTLSQRSGGVFPRDAVASYIDGRQLPAAHGDRYMPVWGDVFDATARVVSGAQVAPGRIDAVISYLQELQYR